MIFFLSQVTIFHNNRSYTKKLGKRLVPLKLGNTHYVMKRKYPIVREDLHIRNTLCHEKKVTYREREDLHIRIRTIKRDETEKDKNYLYFFCYAEKEKFMLFTKL